MLVREAKAIELADRGRVARDGDDWLVFSLNSANRYRVKLSPCHSCECEDFELRKEDCKHILAAWIVSTRGGFGYRLQPDTEEPPYKWPRPTYAQDWPRYDAAQENEKDHFLEMLSELCAGIRELEQGRGRPRFPLAAAVFGAVFKVFSGFSGRRFASDLREAERRGYVGQVANHSTIARCLESKETTPILLSLITASSLPLQAMETTFAVDSSGFPSCKFDRWYNIKWGRMRAEHAWLKAHVIAGTATHVVTAVQVDEENSADYTQFVPLVKATAENFTIREVSADKA
jgi:hypothetical protein